MSPLKHIQFHGITAEFPDGVITQAWSTKFNLENARKNTKVWEGIDFNSESIKRILEDINCLIGTERFNPSDHPIDITFRCSEGTTKMFSIKIQTDPDHYIILRDLWYSLNYNPGSANITPLSFERSSLRTMGFIRKENEGSMKPDDIASTARRLGLRLVSPKDNRILLNNEMPAERKLTKNETSYLKETIRKRLGQVTD